MKTQVKTLGVLTGGGDCPGLNPAIRAVVLKAMHNGCKVIGIQEGWGGLIDGQKEPILLNEHIVSEIFLEGGTMLGSSRTNPFKSSSGIAHLKAHWKALELDALVAIGGEDTLGVAHKLWAQEQMPVVGIPKTIDADLSATDYTLGFETAVEVITECADRVRSTAKSHRRVIVIEAMGRHAGHLALQGGLAAGADIILIPEHNFSVARVCSRLRAMRAQGKMYALVVVAEGAQIEGASHTLQNQDKDAFGHVRLGGIGEQLAKMIEKEISWETRAVTLSHLQRGGIPCAYDRRMGFNLGSLAAEAALEGKFGLMASYVNGQFTLVPLQDAVAQLRVVDVKKFYDTELYQAKITQ